VLLPRDSDQLQLQLGLPWDGVSPRYLTRSAELFTFAPEGTGRTVRDRFPDAQLELFPEGTHYGSSRL